MAEAAAVPAKTRNPLRRLYAWMLSWAHHPAGTWALAVFAFLDSSVFPVPPLFLQVALSLERPRRAWWYATVDLLASVAGAVLGYFIGMTLWDTIGVHVISVEARDRVGLEFQRHAFAFIFLYSFLPFPFKVITIGSGFFHDQVGLATLLTASGIGRAMRFYFLGAMCFFLGERVRTFIENHFNKVTLAIGLLVAAVLVTMKLFVKS